MAASAEHSIKLLGNVLEVPTPRVVLFWIRKHKSTAVLGRHGLVWVENRPKRIQLGTAAWIAYTSLARMSSHEIGSQRHCLESEVHCQAGQSDGLAKAKHNGV